VNDREQLQALADLALDSAQKLFRLAEALEEVEAGHAQQALSLSDGLRRLGQDIEWDLAMERNA
jgi:hypothetical protein